MINMASKLFCATCKLLKTSKSNGDVRTKEVVRETAVFGESTNTVSIDHNTVATDIQQSKTQSDVWP